MNTKPIELNATQTGITFSDRGSAKPWALWVSDDKENLMHLKLQGTAPADYAEGFTQETMTLAQAFAPAAPVSTRKPRGAAFDFAGKITKEDWETKRNTDLATTHGLDPVRVSLARAKFAKHTVKSRTPKIVTMPVPVQAVQVNAALSPAPENIQAGATTETKPAEQPKKSGKATAKAA